MSVSAMMQIGLVALTLTTLGCSGMKTLHCPPNNEPVQVLKNPDKAYPTYAKTHKASIEATKETVDGARRRFGAGIESAVVRLRQELDQESSQVQDILKTAVIGLQTTPCDVETRREFARLVAKVNDRSAQITDLNMNLQRVIATGDSSAVKDGVRTAQMFLQSLPLR